MADAVFFNGWAARETSVLDLRQARDKKVGALRSACGACTRLSIGKVPEMTNDKFSMANFRWRLWKKELKIGH